MSVVTVLGIFAICWVVSPTAGESSVAVPCTITEFSQVSNVVNTCTDITIGDLDVPANETLHLKLQTGSKFRIKGAIRFGFAHWDGPLVKIEGSQLTGFGSPGCGFDGEGAKYWDGKGSQGTKKPVLLEINVHGGEFYIFNLLNCPSRCASIGGSDIFINGWKIDVSDAGSLGVDTDGFDVSGQNITIMTSLVLNQDDCIVVNQGSNMYFGNMYCSGSHGISVGVGIDTEKYENNIVSNITYEDCTLSNTTNGIHVRTVKGSGPGLIENVTFNRITLIDVKEYGIRVYQDYPVDDNKPEGNVPIRDLKISQVRGTMSGNESVRVNVLCAPGACSNWTWSDIQVTGNKKPCSMNYEPSGFSC